MYNATSDLAVVSSGAVAYLIGGYVRANNDLAQQQQATPGVWLYDVTADVFTAGPPLPTGLARGAAAVADNGDLYFAGGRDTQDAIPAASFFRLPRGAAQWTALAGPPTPRSDHCAAFVDGRLHVVGGYDSDNAILGSMESFDPRSGTWSASKLALPTPRGDCACAVLGSALHVVGGVYAFPPKISGTDTTAFGVVQNGGFSSEHAVLDFATGTVTTAAPAPYAAGDAALVPVVSRFGAALMYFGGETFSDKGPVQGTMIPLHYAAQFLADVDVWVPKAPMSQARFRFGAAAFPTVTGEISVLAFGGGQLCHDYDKKQANATSNAACNEMASVENYIDVDLPRIFLYTAN